MTEYCDLVHYNPNKDLLNRIYLFNFRQERKKIKRKTKRIQRKFSNFYDADKEILDFDEIDTELEEQQPLNK